MVKIPVWIIAIAVVIAACFIGYGIADNRRVDLYPPRIYPKEVGLSVDQKDIFKGTWYGFFMEYVSSRCSVRRAQEEVKFSPFRLAATVVTTEPVRDREIIYTYHDNIFIAHYYASRAGISGGAAYILSGSMESGILKGYYICTDPEKDGKLVIGPYILTTHDDADYINQQYAIWLNQSMVEAPCR